DPLTPELGACDQRIASTRPGECAEFPRSRAKVDEPAVSQSPWTSTVCADPESITVDPCIGIWVRSDVAVVPFAETARTVGGAIVVPPLLATSIWNRNVTKFASW